MTCGRPVQPEPEARARARAFLQINKYLKHSPFLVFTGHTTGSQVTSVDASPLQRERGRREDVCTKRLHYSQCLAWCSRPRESSPLNSRLVSSARRREHRRVQSIRRRRRRRRCRRRAHIITPSERSTAISPLRRSTDNWQSVGRAVPPCFYYHLSSTCARSPLVLPRVSRPTDHFAPTTRPAVVHPYSPSHDGSVHPRTVPFPVY